MSQEGNGLKQGAWGKSRAVCMGIPPRNLAQNKKPSHIGFCMGEYDVSVCNDCLCEWDCLEMGLLECSDIKEKEKYYSRFHDIVYSNYRI